MNADLYRKTLKKTRSRNSAPITSVRDETCLGRQNKVVAPRVLEKSRSFRGNLRKIGRDEAEVGPRLRIRMAFKICASTVVGRAKIRNMIILSFKD